MGISRKKYGKKYEINLVDSPNGGWTYGKNWKKSSSANPGNV
jgi:hypothetical protein